MSRVVDIARKLKALAEDSRGNSNEQENASILLEQYLKRHGLSINEIDEEQLCEFYYIADSKDEAKIFVQVFFSIMDFEGKISAYKYGPWLKSQGIKRSQEVIKYYCPHYMDGLIVEKMEFYWYHYQAEHSAFMEKIKMQTKMFTTAYIHRNELFSENQSKTKKKYRGGITPAEYEALQKLMNSMEKKTMNKMLAA